MQWIVRHTNIRKILTWITANTVFATLFYVLGVQEARRLHPEMSRLAIYLNQLATFQILSGMAAGTAYYVNRRMRPRPYWQTTLLTLPFTLPAAVAGIAILLTLQVLIYGPTLEEFSVTLKNSKGDLMVSLFITGIITVIAARLEFLENERQRRNESAPPLRSSLPSSFTETDASRSADRLILRSKDGQIFLPCNEILFVSSHGPVSVVHTEKGEHRTGMLLKEVEAKLSANQFGRIHKSFVVNLHRIARLQYDRGGSYLAFLNDSESTVLPVGRRFAGNIKNALSALHSTSE